MAGGFWRFRGWVVGVKSARKLGREPRAKNVLEAATALLPAPRARKALAEALIKLSLIMYE